MRNEEIMSKLEGNGALPIGIRGISYEKVIHLFENRLLTGNEEQAKKTGGVYVYIYFWPLLKNWEANGLTPLPTSGGRCQDPTESSKIFAKIHADDFFNRLCGFTIGEYEGTTRSRLEDTPAKVRKAMGERGLTDTNIADLIEETKRRKGYILEFHPDMARDYKIEPDPWFGRNHSFSFQINCPDGLDQRYISRITPVGEWDMELINRYMREQEVCMPRAR